MNKNKVIKLLSELDNLKFQVYTKIQELVDEIKLDLHEDFIMPFGKHAGKMIKELPIDYVNWLRLNGNLSGYENKSLKIALDHVFPISKEEP